MNTCTAFLFRLRDDRVAATARSLLPGKERTNCMKTVEEWIFEFFEGQQCQRGQQGHQHQPPPPQQAHHPSPHPIDESVHHHVDVDDRGDGHVIAEKMPPFLTIDIGGSDSDNEPLKPASI